MSVVQDRTVPHVDGMGAIVTDGGVAFRVWAPNADAVSVVGDFNDWDGADHALTNEGNGHWYGFAEDAKVGQEYKFRITNGERTFDRIDPRALQVTNSVGSGVIYDHAAFDWQGDDHHISSHNELVIYELHIGSFYTKDDDNPGTFKLAASQFEHFKRLGVNAIQIMPVAEFAGDYSWGYNPAHVYAVESAYGGPDALKRFVREAHQHGLSVILDVVYNHFGPSDLDLWQFDGWSENDKGGIYFYQDHRSETPWGDTRPDYGREEVRRFIHDNAMMWLRDYHMDGLRFDMTPYMRSIAGSGIEIQEGWDVMRWVNTSVREEFPGRITIAEDMHQDPRISQVDNHGAAFHAQWDGAFVHPVREAVTVHSDQYRSMDEVRDAISKSYNGDAFQRVVYTESHDEVANGQARVPQEVHDDDPTGYHAQKLSTLGSSLVFTAPGIPMIFQGQEFLQGEWFRDDVPIDWDLNDEYRGIVKMYRDLINLRRNTTGKTKGLTGHGINVFHVNDADNVMAFQRWAEHGANDDVVVVVNLSAQERHDYQIGMPAGGRWELVFNSDFAGYSDDFNGVGAGDLIAVDEPRDGFGASATVSIGAYTTLIYSWQG